MLEGHVIFNDCNGGLEGYLLKINNIIQGVSNEYASNAAYRCFISCSIPAF